jgi:HSP20 family protein
MMSQDFDWEKVQDKMEKVLGDEFFSEMTKLVPKRGPEVDVYETEQEVVVVASIPGLPFESDYINIYIEGYKLFIEGNIPCLYPAEHKKIKSERFFGPFKREVSLPFNVSIEGIDAKYKKGLLNIHVPKKKGDKNTKIPVQYGELE